MADKAIKGSACPVAFGLQSGDRIITVATQNSVVNTFIVTTAELLANTNVPIGTIGNNSLSTANLIVKSVTAPLTSGSPGVQGQIVYDGGFVYVCVATNTWKRAALSSF